MKKNVLLAFLGVAVLCAAQPTNPPKPPPFRTGYMPLSAPLKAGTVLVFNDSDSVLRVQGPFINEIMDADRMLPAASHLNTDGKVYTDTRRLMLRTPMFLVSQAWMDEFNEAVRLKAEELLAQRGSKP